MEKKKFYLKWPWNLLVYIVLALILRIFAIPVILLLMAWNKKQQPDGPEEGYCMQRTRMRLANLVWAVLFLLISLCVGVYFVAEIQERLDEGGLSGQEFSFYGQLAVAAVISLAAFAAAIYEGFTALRDALFPEKSRLAKSIRSQLRSPDEAPPVKELFAMVDHDIKENGQWFDRAAVGKEWLLGDDASLLSRIRVVFGRNEIQRTHRGGRVQTRRIIQLYVLDDRKQVQVTGLRNPDELQALLNCLKLRCPDALFRPYKEYLDYTGKNEEEWHALLREFNARQSARKAAETDNAQPADPLDFIQTDLSQPEAAFSVADLGLDEEINAEEPSKLEKLRFILTLSERNGTTRSYRTPTLRDVELAAQGLSDGKYTVVHLGGGSLYIYLQSGTAEDGRVTVNVCWPAGDGLHVYETKCSDRQAKRHLLTFANGHVPEDLSDWKDITKKLERQLKKAGK